MKRFPIFALLLPALLFLSGCGAFTTPLFRSSAGFSDKVADMSTGEIASSIELCLADPEQVSIMLAELARRDPAELVSLPLEGKESILSAAVSAVLPMSAVTDSVQKAMDSDEELDSEALVDNAVASGTSVDTTAVELLLGDAEVLKEADAYTLVMSAAALTASVIKNETGDGETVKSKLDELKSISSAVNAGTEDFDEEQYKQALRGAGYDEASVGSMLVVMDILSVMTGTSGTGGDGEPLPDRSDEAAGISLFGFSMDDFLTGLLGAESPEQESGGSGDASQPGEGEAGA